jgi:drug/metabolite transporter (DMT)-like permease
MLAGLFTAAAFFALTSAMRHITIVRANLLNASQISLTSLAGVLLFGEPFGRGMVVGTVLTVAGLLLMDRPQSSPEPGVGRRSKNP